MAGLPTASKRSSTKAASVRFHTGPSASPLSRAEDRRYAYSYRLGDAIRRYVAFDPQTRSSLSVFESQERSFAIGDRVQFTMPWTQMDTASREAATVEHVDGSGNMAIRLKGGRRIGWNLKEYSHIDHAYAVTSHFAQGMTVDHVPIHVDTTDSRIRGLLVLGAAKNGAIDRSDCHAHIKGPATIRLWRTLGGLPRVSRTDSAYVGAEVVR